jgi:hypothetical protein
VRRAGRLQIGDRRTDAACVVFEKTHGAIAFIAEEPADYSCRVTVIHAKGARGRPFADGARAVLLRQESVVVLQRHPKDDFETKPTARLARSATLSVAKLGIGRVPTPVAGVDLFPILLVIDPIFSSILARYSGSSAYRVLSTTTTINPSGESLGSFPLPSGTGAPPATRASRGASGGKERVVATTVCESWIRCG